MNGTIRVTGGTKLIGEVTPIPNKNSILPALAASILTTQTTTYKNVPKSTDVQNILEMLKLLGAQIDDSDFNNLKIDGSQINKFSVDENLGSKIRASILFAGPLLARFGKAEIPIPGGCVLGYRHIGTHIDNFKKMGVRVEEYNNKVVLTKEGNSNTTTVWQLEASPTATENLIMYAAGINSETKIIGAATEPHVTQVVQMVQNMGATVTGIGSNTLTIVGNTNLQGTDFSLYPDHIDIIGYIVATAITKGNIKILGANNYEIMGGIIDLFRKFNLSITEDGNNIIVDGSQELKIDTHKGDFPLAGTNLPKLVARPWPGFPVDGLPPMITLACKLQGKLLVQNWMYETGLDVINELNNMGANIFMADPQKAIVFGPINFTGGQITPPAIIQSAMAVFLASLADEVETTISGVDILKRRYPDIFEVYKNLGAHIEVLS